MHGPGRRAVGVSLGLGYCTKASVDIVDTTPMMKAASWHGLMKAQTPSLIMKDDMIEVGFKLRST